MIVFMLKNILSSPFPNKTTMRRNLYRPSFQDVFSMFHMVNTELFNMELQGELTIRLRNRFKYWGETVIYSIPGKTYPEFNFADKWPCQHLCVCVIAHECVHLWQHQNGITLAHDNSFYSFKEKFESYGIPLGEQYRVSLSKKEIETY